MLGSRTRFTLSLILFAFGSDSVSAESNSCFSAAQIAGIIFVTSFTTFFAVIGIALLLWYFYRNRTLEKDFITTVENGVEKTGKTVCNEREFETENKAVEASITAFLADKMTSCNSLVSKCQDDEGVLEKNQKNQLKQQHFSRSQTTNHDFQSYDSINVLKDVVRCLLDKDTSALGFQIAQRSDGICISHVEPNGPAHRSGNIFVGDKIKELTITFEKMPISDALTILSCASTYKIRLELERAIVGDTIQPSSIETVKHRRQAASSRQAQQFSTLCKSHSTSDLALATQKEQAPMKVINGGSFMSKQKYQLPRPTITPVQEEAPSAAHEVPSSEQCQPSPEITEDAGSIPVTMEPVIAEETITITEQFPQSAGAVPKHPRTTSQTVSSSPQNSSAEMSFKVTSKTDEVVNSSSPDKPFQQQSSRIPSPRGKHPVVLLASKVDHKMDEIKHDGFSEFVERTQFTYSSAATAKDAKRKSCVEFCELIEPKRESIVIEFEEDQELSQGREEQVGAGKAAVTNLMKCSGACSEQMQSDGQKASLAVEGGGVTMSVAPAVMIAPNGVAASAEGVARCVSESTAKAPDVEHGTSQSDVQLEASGGRSESTSGTIAAQNSNSVSQIPHSMPAMVPNGAAMATASKMNGNRVVPYSTSVTDSPSSHRKATNRAPPSTAGQKSPKKSRHRNISSGNANVDEAVAAKVPTKPEGGPENWKDDRNGRSHIPQRSPKLSPKLQSHIPIVARTPSTKSRNKLSTFESSESADSSLAPVDSKTVDDALKEEMNGASLYIAKKEALRKTFLPYSKTNKSEEVDLSKERRARLDANQALLQRQQEELRALGVLP